MVTKVAVKVQAKVLSKQATQSKQRLLNFGYHKAHVEAKTLAKKLHCSYAKGLYSYATCCPKL